MNHFIKITVSVRTTFSEEAINYEALGIPRPVDDEDLSWQERWMSREFFINDVITLHEGPDGTILTLYDEKVYTIKEPIEYILEQLA